MSLLELKNVTKTYQNKVTAVKDVSFSGKSGEFIVLVGPSGCGKSTILRSIAGLEDISSGDICVDGVRINDSLPRERNIGMVFQNYALYPHLTVYDNIAFPLIIKKEKKAAIKEKVEEIANILDLTEFLNRRPKELSGGQRQRVALGRAIAKNPKIFLFDEPLSNLDAKLRVQMRSEILNLHKRLNAISIYVTHDQVEAMTMGDKIVTLDKGEIQQIAPAQEIYDNPANLFVASFIGSPQINIFRGEIRGSTFYSNDNASFNLESNEIKSERKEAYLAIRPEHMRITGDLNENGFKSKIVNIERLGHEVVVYFRTNDHLNSVRIDIKSSSSIEADIAPDKECVFIPDTSKIMFFDYSTHQRI